MTRADTGAEVDLGVGLEQTNLVDESLRSRDDGLSVKHSLGGLGCVGVVVGSLGVLQFVAASTEGAELTEPGAELGSRCLFDGVVAHPSS